jgi:O-antigen ligase
MIRPLTNSTFPKSRTLIFLEYVLLALCLCVIAIRATFTESPAIRPSTSPTNLGDVLYSLYISTALFIAFVIWFVSNVCSKKFPYRVTGIEIGLCIFIIGAIAAGFAAADKRLAITTIAIFIAPALMAILLVQILDSQSKIKLLLATIAALGVVSTYQCAEQHLFSNQATIEEYERSPQTFLEPLGIEPGTFQQFLFEHRLYTKGVHGFFTTSNSAGSFAMMASFAAIILFIDKLKNHKSNPSWPIYILTSGFATAVVFLGLILTQSKGAIIGALFAAAIFIILLCFGRQVSIHKKAILTICLLLVIAAVCLALSYGLKHGRLPGGKSMLVRWQYWQASAKMYADHPLTGVGPGNFATFYTRYKPAAALESVADPHNFPLSLLTQYGPLGLIGFLAIIFIPLWKALSTFSTDSSPKDYHPKPAFRTLALTFLIIILLALLFIRPLLMPLPPADTLDVTIYLILTLYITPIAVFIIAFLLLTAPLIPARNTTHHSPLTNYHSPVMSVTAALFAAVIGVALHNLIDFAIFEPPVLTTLFAIIACLIATNNFQYSRPPLVLKFSPLFKIPLIIAASVIIWAYLNFALIPAARTTAKIEKAHQAISAGRFDHAHHLLNLASDEDQLNPLPLSLNGKLYLHQFQVTQSKNSELLLQAERCLQVVIKRNNADFKNFERLTDIYVAFGDLAEISKPQEKNDWLNKALESAQQAVELYPGCERLHFELAKIAEHLGKIDIALEHYKRAVEIEDSFRSQFKMMYPNREIVSRLGEEKYQFAIERISRISH